MPRNLGRRDGLDKGRLYGDNIFEWVLQSLWTLKRPGGQGEYFWDKANSVT